MSGLSSTYYAPANTSVPSEVQSLTVSTISWVALRKSSALACSTLCTTSNPPPLYTFILFWASIVPASTDLQCCWIEVSAVKVVGEAEVCSLPVAAYWQAMQEYCPYTARHTELLTYESTALRSSMISFSKKTSNEVLKVSSTVRLTTSKY